MDINKSTIFHQKLHGLVFYFPLSFCSSIDGAEFKERDFSIMSLSDLLSHKLKRVCLHDQCVSPSLVVNVVVYDGLTVRGGKCLAACVAVLTVLVLQGRQ